MATVEPVDDLTLYTNPHLVADGASGILVFWRNQRLQWTDDRLDFMLLEGQRFAPDGTRRWGPKAKVLRARLRLRSRAPPGFAVFWDRRNGTPDDMDVYGTLYREK